MKTQVLLLALSALICATQADMRQIFKKCLDKSGVEHGDLRKLHHCKEAKDLNDKQVGFLHCMMMENEMMAQDCSVTADAQFISDKIDKKCDEMAEGTGAVAAGEDGEQKEDGGDDKKKKKGCWWKKLCESDTREEYKKNMTECADKAKEAFNSSAGSTDQCRNTVFAMKDCIKKKMYARMGRGKGKKND